MVEELPPGVNSVEADEAANGVSIEEGQTAALGVSAVLLRAKRQADELVERARTKDGDLNGGAAAVQAAVSLTKDEI